MVEKSVFRLKNLDELTVKKLIVIIRRLLDIITDIITSYLEALRQKKNLISWKMELNQL